MNRDFKPNPIFKFGADSVIYFKDSFTINGKEYEFKVAGDFQDYPVAHIFDYECKDYLIRLDTLEYIGNYKFDDNVEGQLMKYLSEPDPHYPVDNKIISAISEWNFGYKNTYGVDYRYDTDYLMNISENTRIKCRGNIKYE